MQYTTPNDEASPASFIIYKEGTIIKAFNTVTRNINSGSDASTVIQSALGNLTSGRTWKEKVVLKGNFELSDTVHISSYTIFELSGKIQLKSGLANTHSLVDMPLSGGGKHIEIIGGIYDGNYTAYNASWGNRLDSPQDSQGINIADILTYDAQHIDDIIIRDVTVSNTVRSNIFGGGNNIKILNCIFSNALCDHFLYLATLSNSVIHGCDFSGFTTTEGIALGTATQPLITKNITVDNNKFHDFVANVNGYTMNYPIGIRDDLCDNISVFNNDIDIGTELFTEGIYVGSENCSVVNNTIKGIVSINSYGSIETSRGNVIIRGNKILNHGSNTITQYPIRVYPTSADVSNIQISDNYVYNSSTTANARGICLWAGLYNISYVLIENNNIYTKDRAIKISGYAKIVDNVDIIGNKIYAHTGRWIVEDTSGGGSVTNMNYSNNTVFGTLAATFVSSPIIKNNRGYITDPLPSDLEKIASANVRNSHNAEASTAVTSYTKVKTITLTNGLLGQLRVLFDLKTGTAPNAINGRVYHNGVALGTEQSDVTGGYVTKSQDITQDWQPGDTIELWLKAHASATAYAQNFQLAYDDSPTVAVTSANS